MNLLVFVFHFHSMPFMSKKISIYNNKLAYCFYADFFFYSGGKSCREFKTKWQGKL